MSLYLFIVAQDKPELRDYLTGWFSGVATVQVVVDRRQGERRRPPEASEPGRRRGDRRSQKEIDAEIRRTGFAIVGISSR